MSDERLQPVEAENVLVSPRRRQGAILHVARGGGVSPAAADELRYIAAHLPDVAAFGAGDMREVLAALEQQREGYAQASEALARERAELEGRLARVKKQQAAAAKLAAALVE